MSSATVPFELHLTVDGLEPYEEEAFCAFCLDLQGKPLMIELSQGRHPSQPMFNKIIMESTAAAARDRAGIYASRLKEMGYKVSRIKIEVPAYCAEHPAVIPGKDFAPYYEWHGKVPYLLTDELLQLCSTHGAHLSRNALRHNSETRFVTLREYGSGLVFEQRLEGLKSALAAGPWQPQKEQSEYCIYDDNTGLDKGWLP